MGYRFDARGPWSEPPVTLYSKRYADSPRAAALATHFKTQSGADCGTHIVQFVLTVKEGRSFIRSYYTVNNSDLGDLVKLIATCMAQN